MRTVVFLANPRACYEQLLQQTSDEKYGIGDRVVRRIGIKFCYLLITRSVSASVSPRRGIPPFLEGIGMCGLSTLSAGRGASRPTWIRRSADGCPVRQRPLHKSIQWDAHKPRQHRFRRILGLVQSTHRFKNR